MTRIVGPTGSRRRRRFLFAPVVLVAAAFALFRAGSARAVHDLSFELDGNVTTQGSTTFNSPTYDWASFFDASGNKLPLPANFTASGFDRDFVTNPDGSFATSDTTTFATGSKDTLNPTPGWQCAFANNVNSK